MKHLIALLALTTSLAYADTTITVKRDTSAYGVGCTLKVLLNDRLVAEGLKTGASLTLPVDAGKHRVAVETGAELFCPTKRRTQVVTLAEGETATFVYRSNGAAQTLDFDREE